MSEALGKDFDKAAYLLDQKTIRRVRTIKDNFSNGVIEGGTAMHLVDVALSDRDTDLNNLMNETERKMKKWKI